MPKNTSWFVYNIWFFYKIFCCIFVYIRLFCTSQNKSKTLMEYVNALPFNLCMSKNGKSAIRTHWKFIICNLWSAVDHQLLFSIPSYSARPSQWWINRSEKWYEEILKLNKIMGQIGSNLQRQPFATKSTSILFHLIIWWNSADTYFDDDENSSIYMRI